MRSSHGRRQDFFQGWGIEGVWKTEGPQRGPGPAEPRWGPSAMPPEADDILWKQCINTSSVETVDNICSTKTLHFQGKCPPPVHSCVRPWQLPFPSSLHFLPSFLSPHPPFLFPIFPPPASAREFRERRNSPTGSGQSLAAPSDIWCIWGWNISLKLFQLKRV